MPHPPPLTFAELPAILRRNAVVLLACLAAGLACAGVLLSLTNPRYAATTLIEINATSGEATAPMANARVNSEVEILRSDAVGLATIKAAGLLGDSEFALENGRLARLRTWLGLAPIANNDAPALLSHTLEKLNKSLHIRRMGQTYLIAVSARARTPEKAAHIANTLSETYISRQLAAKITRLHTAQALVGQQIEAARASLVESDLTYQRVMDQEVSQISNGQAPMLAALTNRLASLTGERSRLQSRALSLQGALAREEWQVLVQKLESEAAHSWQRHHQLLSEKVMESKENSPVSQKLRREIGALERRIGAQAGAELEAVEASLARIENETLAQRAALHQKILETPLPAPTLIDLFELRQQAEAAQEHYGALVLRRQALRAQALAQVSDSRIVSHALPPSGAESPNGPLIWAVAVLLSLGAGGAIALAREARSDVIRHGRALNHSLSDVPAMTMQIPEAEPAPELLGPADLTVFDPLSPFSEALRSLRAAIDGACPEERGKVILVTSPGARDGKSTLALALARTYALAGRRSLLLDANLRQPSLHRLVGAAPRTGLGEYLRDWENPAHKEGFYISDSLSDAGIVLGAGESISPTDELLRSQVFQTLIADARAAMDVIVIDAPALLSQTDGQYLAPHADIAVLCGACDATRHHEMRLAARILREGMPPGASLLPVLTRISGRDSALGYAA